MFKFTVEETNFMSYFDTSSRKALIHDMKTTPLNDVDDETAEMMYRLVRKLEKMTDDEFDSLYIMPDSLLY